MIPFIDLQAQRKRLGQPLEDAILKVVRSGAYIMGPEIAELERQLAAFGQAPHALACGSGTEALILPLMAWGIGPGDAVFCPSFTFAATAEVMPLVGASPVFVDIDPDTYNLDPESLQAAIEAVKREGKLTPRAVIAVDLFGQPADYPAIARVAGKHGLKLSRVERIHSTRAQDHRRVSAGDAVSNRVGMLHHYGAQERVWPADQPRYLCIHIAHQRKEREHQSSDARQS